MESTGQCSQWLIHVEDNYYTIIILYEHTVTTQDNNCVELSSEKSSYSKGTPMLCCLAVRVCLTEGRLTSGMPMYVRSRCSPPTTCGQHNGSEGAMLDFNDPPLVCPPFLKLMSVIGCGHCRLAIGARV